MKLDSHSDIAEAVLSSLDSGIIIVSADRVLRAFNTRFQSLWRFPQPPQIGQSEKPILECIARHLMHPQSFREQVERIYAAGDHETFDLLQLNDGRVVERHSALYVAGGQTLGRIWSFHDLTRALEWERQSLESGRRESISRLAAAVAHDFGHVVTSIQGSTHQLLSNPRGNPDETVRNIALAAQRAENLATHLQSFGHKTAGHLRVLDLNQLVARVVNQLQAVIPASVELLFEPALELPEISCHPGMIEQALTNLTCNAIEAMVSDGGQLRVSTRFAEIDSARAGHHEEARPGSFVCLAVTDTGCGIEKKNLRNIFDPFFTTKGDQKKPGLGLARVYGIAKLHRGWVEVSSQVGYGSTFTLFLPFESDVSRSETQPAASDRPEHAFTAPAPSREKRALVVLDNA
jgi:signal transduction histidine kinase